VQWSVSGQIITESNHINEIILWVYISLYTQAKSKEYKLKNFLSLWSPPINPTISSRATPMGSASRAPDEKKKKEKDFKLFVHITMKGNKKRR
jgi:hypothetical protein